MADRPTGPSTHGGAEFCSTSLPSCLGRVPVVRPRWRYGEIQWLANRSQGIEGASIDGSLQVKPAELDSKGNRHVEGYPTRPPCVRPDRTHYREVRTKAGLSWAEIASALGVARQAAWERWHEVDETLPKSDALGLLTERHGARAISQPRVKRHP